MSALLFSISVLLVPTSGLTQSKEEHLSHHPELAAQATAGAGFSQAAPNAQVVSPGMVPGGAVPPRGASGMMQGMGEMMKNMGLPPKKDFYPSLMEIPSLTPERWNEIQQTAHGRMVDGLGQLSRGLGALSGAIDADNFALTQQALAEMRQGIRLVESGLSAHRLLAEGESPRNIALSWFKTEMNLRDEAVLHPQGFFWLSLFHILVMVLLSLFSATMILMYFFKMRRAAVLLERLTGEGVGVITPPPPKSGGGGTPPNGGTPPSSDPISSKSVPSAGTGAKAESKIKATWAGRLKVSNIFRETPNVKTFRLVSPLGKGLPFTYLPGQFLTLSALIDKKTVTRSYTIASSPTEVSFCDLTIKREDQGTFSRYLHDLIKEGDLIDAKGPSGPFVFTGIETNSIVLIGAGIGITPMMSVLRFLTAKAWPGKITLLFTFRNSGDYLFQRELEELKSKIPNFKLVVTATGEVGSDWIDLRGRITKELLATAVPDIASSRVHLCGPVLFMEGMKKFLSELSVPKEAIKTEAFGSMRKDEPVTPLGREGKTSIVSTSTTVNFTSSSKKAALPPTMSVLEAAESIGMHIENSCRVGTCGICKVKLVFGQVTMEVEDGLSAEEKANGFILACQAKSTENIGVEA